MRICTQIYAKKGKKVREREEQPEGQKKKIEDAMEERKDKNRNKKRPTPGRKASKGFGKENDN